MNLWSFYS